MRRLLLSAILLSSLNVFVSSQAIAQARQLVVISAPSWSSETGKLKMLSNVSGVWVQHGHEVAVVLGHGLAWGRGLHPNPKSGPKKREGDGRSPAGIFSLGPAFGYAKDPPSGCRLPYRTITEQDYFVDDPNAKEYNQWVELPRGTSPIQLWRSAEKMLRSDGLYVLGIVIDQNVDPIVKSRGSAIFFPEGATIAAVGRHYEELGALVRLDYIRFDVVYEVVPFPDGFWAATKPIREEAQSNWSIDENGKHTGLRDFWKNFEYLKQQYDRQRDLDRKKAQNPTQIEKARDQKK